MKRILLPLLTVLFLAACSEDRTEVIEELEDYVDVLEEDIASLDEEIDEIKDSRNDLQSEEKMLKDEKAAILANKKTLQEDIERSEEHTLNSSHVSISYAVFCLKKKKQKTAT